MQRNNEPLDSWGAEDNNNELATFWMAVEQQCYAMESILITLSSQIDNANFAHRLAETEKAFEKYDYGRKCCLKQMPQLFG